MILLDSNLLFTYPHSKNCLLGAAASVLPGLCRDYSHSPGPATSSLRDLEVKWQGTEEVPVTDWPGQQTWPDAERLFWQNYLRSKRQYYTQEFTSATISVTPAAKLARLRPGALGYLEVILLDFVLLLPRVLVLELDVTLPSPRVLLLQAVNDNATGVLYMALSRGLQVNAWHLVINRNIIPHYTDTAVCPVHTAYFSSFENVSYRETVMIQIPLIPWDKYI